MGNMVEPGVQPGGETEFAVLSAAGPPTCDVPSRDHLEAHRRADASVAIPPALQPHLGGRKVLEPGT